MKWHFASPKKCTQSVYLLCIYTFGPTLTNNLHDNVDSQ